MENNGARLASAEMEALAALSVSAVKGVPVSGIPEGLELKRLSKLAKSNYITGIVYPAIKRSAEFFPAEFVSSWKNEATKQAAYLLIQNRQREELKKLLCSAEVPFVGLKGYVIGGFYPADTVRACADIDIAVPTSERKRIRGILIENGYIEGDRGANHDSYEKNGVSVEIHHHLYSETPQFYEYFRGIFGRMVTVHGSSCEHRMNEVDFTVFQVMHAYRHFTGGGIGFRLLLDHYLTERNISVAEEELRPALEELGLWQFYRVIDTISRKLFDGEALNSDEAFVVEYMINGGIFGTELNNASMKHSEYKRVSTARYILSRAFLPYYDMKIRYPVLEKNPLALPFCHIHRWVKATVNYRGGIKSEISASNAVTPQDIEEKRRLKKIITDKDVDG